MPAEPEAAAQPQLALTRLRAFSPCLGAREPVMTGIYFRRQHRQRKRRSHKITTTTVGRVLILNGYNRYSLTGRRVQSGEKSDLHFGRDSLPASSEATCSLLGYGAGGASRRRSVALGPGNHRYHRYHPQKECLAVSAGAQRVTDALPMLLRRSF